MRRRRFTSVQIIKTLKEIESDINNKKICGKYEISKDFKKGFKLPVIVAFQHEPIKTDKDVADSKFDIATQGSQLFIDLE